MKCPTCLSTMKCISEIHQVPGQPGRQRMYLHCSQPSGEGRRCGAWCYMGVLIEDPKEWVCHTYHFQFQHNEQFYWLSSRDWPVDPVHQRYKEPLTRLNSSTNTLIMLPYFMPISTGDDMHERAWELFHRLKNLVIYS